MKILVTGGNGFLGSHIIESLTQQGYEVCCLVRASANLQFLSKNKSLEFLVGSLHDQVTLQRAVQGVNAVIHAAALTSTVSPHHYYEVNVDGTLALLTAVKRYAPMLQRFILISSLAAAGDPHSQALTDLSCPLVPVSHYGRSKLMAEHQARLFADQLPITIIRPPAIYGPRDNKMLIFFKLLQKGLLLVPLRQEAMVSTIYAADAALAIEKAISADVPSGSTYFIDDGSPQSFINLFQQLAEAIEAKIRFKVTLPYWLMKSVAVLADQYSFLSRKPAFFSSDKLRELREPYWVCSSEKTKQALNWTPTIDWTTGVKLTYDWYKTAGWC